MSFTCECGCHFFKGSSIQGGQYMDVSLWYAINCLKCNKPYLFHEDFGFVQFDVSRVK